MPSFVTVSGSLNGSMSMRPDSAYATTRGGLARKFAFTAGCTRPSKLRLPERIDAATRSPSLMPFSISGGKGPELPMQVVQPYPTVWNPSASRSAVRFDLLRYSVTTLLPGAREVLTQGLRVRPSSFALRATSPAAMSTSGLEVLVHEVIAAMTIEPCVRGAFMPTLGGWQASVSSISTMVCSSPFLAGSGLIAAASVSPPSPDQRLRLTPSWGTGLPKVSVMSLCQVGLNESSAMRSCGRLGPATQGLTVERSSSRVAANSGSGASGVQ